MEREVKIRYIADQLLGAGQAMDRATALLIAENTVQKEEEEANADDS